MNMIAEDYLIVGAVALVGALIVAITIEGVSRLLRPYKPVKDKYETYECGEIAIGTTRINFGAQYYLYALVFVIFDVEVVILFPWAVAFADLGWFGFVEVMLFVSILVVGFVYAWRKGALDWIEKQVN